MSCDVENCSSEIGRHSKLSARKIRYKNENNTSEKTIADEKEDLKIDTNLFRMARKHAKKSPVQRSCCGGAAAAAAAAAEHGQAAGGVTSHNSINKKSSPCGGGGQPDAADSSDSNDQYSCHHYHNNHFHSDEAVSKCRPPADHSRSPFRENTNCSNHQPNHQPNHPALSQHHHRSGASARSVRRATSYTEESDAHDSQHPHRHHHQQHHQHPPSTDDHESDDEEGHLHDELDDDSDEPEEEIEEDEGSYTDQEESTDQSTTTSSTSTLHNLHNLRGAGSANDEDNKSDKSGNCCNCCYCEVFGHGVPTKAPTSRNFDEIRDRLRTRLKSKKNNDNCHKSTSEQDELLSDHHSSSNLNHKRNSHLLSQFKANEPSQKRDERDLDELLRFINEGEGTKCETTKNKKKKDKKKKKSRPTDGELQADHPADHRADHRAELVMQQQPRQRTEQQEQQHPKNGNQKKANCDKQQQPSRQSLRDEKNQRHAKQSLSTGSAKNGREAARRPAACQASADDCNSRVLFKGADCADADQPAKQFIPNNDQNSSSSKGKKQQPNKKSGRPDKKVTSSNNHKQPADSNSSSSSNCNGQRNNAAAAATTSAAEKGSCKKTNNKDSLLDDVFLPKDLDYEDEVDEFEKELEEFKRFCFNSFAVPLPNKEKVNLDLKNIVIKKKKNQPV